MTFAENSITIPVANNEEIRQLLGRFDQHVTLLERYFKVNIIPQGNAVIVEGNQEDTEKVAFLFRELLWLLQQGQVPTVPDVEYAIELIRTDKLNVYGACWRISFILRPAAKNQAKDHRAKRLFGCH